MSRVDAWLTEGPWPPPAEAACELSADDFWQEPLERLIGTHPDWPDASYLLDLEPEVAHALVLVLSRLPAEARRPFADAFYAERRGGGAWAASYGSKPYLADPRARLAVAAVVALQVFELIGDPAIADERVRDLLEGAAQGDDLTSAPWTVVDEVRKVVARVRLEVAFDDPASPCGAAAHALAEVLDPSGDSMDLKEVIARSAWAAVTSWESPRVLALLLRIESLIAQPLPRAT